MLLNVIGCLSTPEIIDNRSSEDLIYSASSKIVIAGDYIRENEDEKAIEILSHALSDLDKTKNILNESGIHNEDISELDKAVYNLKSGIRSVESSMPANHSLDKAIGELVELSAKLSGNDSLPPQRFSVIDLEIPITYYDRVDGIYIGYQVVPHNIAQASRESFYKYHNTKDEEDLKRGIFLADYLVSTAKTHNNEDFIVWENNFIWPPYDLPTGWIGSLSQAGTLKALMLAYQATGDKKYLESAKKALRAFEVDVDEGGLLYYREDGEQSYVWFPEYAKSEPPFVLNGFITAIVWLNEYGEFMNDEKAGSLSQEGLKSVKHFLPTYDNGKGWSYYDAKKNKASTHYHKLHLIQLETLHNITQDEIYLDYKKSWNIY